MGAFFNFSLLDVWNSPEMRMLRGTTKLAAKGLSSAMAKSDSKTAETSEFMELMSRARAGDDEAQLDLALHYAEKHDFDKANEWLLKSAKQGNQHALEILAMLCGD